MLISVIIPALNEAASIGRAIASAAGPDIEVIVADGGSADETVALARAAGAGVIVCPGGRAAQQNAAAAKSSGELLVFLHADTLLPRSWDDHVRSVLAKPGMGLGAFRLSIDGGTRAEQMIAWSANLRSRWFGLPYGDQALFLTRARFQELGGFRVLPIMEDWDLVRRAGKHGRILLASAAVQTSARRWRKLGPLRTTLINAVVVAGFRLGVPPHRLAAMYRAVGSEGRWPFVRRRTDP